MIDAAIDSAEAVERRRVLGDSEFDALYRRMVRPLWTYVLRMTQDPAAADDIVQKAFIQILRTELDGGEEARVRGLLYRIATNLAIDHLRRTRREREGWLGAWKGERSDRADLRHDVDRAFSRLSARERSLLWLAYVEGFDHDEIAAAAHVQARSVRVLLFRARRRLLEVLRAMGLGPEVLR